MITRDNTTIHIKFPKNAYGDRDARNFINTLRSWLKERNIKYTLVFHPIWHTIPSAINMRNEDAIMFKLVFNF